MAAPIIDIAEGVVLKTIKSNMTAKTAYIEELRHGERARDLEDILRYK